MAKARPELEDVKQLILENPRMRAGHIAEKVGLVDDMGYDKAVDYVRSVKKRLRKSGSFEEAMMDPKLSQDEERLEDITKLIELRNGKMSKKAAYNLLLLNCYYRMRSKEDQINWTSIDHTYALNDSLQNPYSIHEAIRICEIAMEKYMDSRDEEKNKRARLRGLPNAGLNYSAENLYYKLEVTDEEAVHLKTIRKRCEQ